MYLWLLQLKNEDGSFSMHVGGESDVRSTYCALVVASLLNLLTPQIRKNAVQYIARCQTYEGGMGGQPGNEAHGGYAFCGLAGLAILDATDAIDLKLFLVHLPPPPLSFFFPPPIARL